MSRLTDVATAFNLPYEASDSGEWVRYPCANGGRRYVVRSRLADGYLAWCDTGRPRALEWHPTPEAAIDHGRVASGDESSAQIAQPAGPMRYNHPEPVEARR